MAFGEFVPGSSTGCTHRIVTLLEDDTFCGARENLINHVVGIINDTEIKEDIAEFVIGKTFADAHLDLNFMLDPYHPETWDLKGIDSRWRVYEKKGYKFLVVIACVEENLFPEDSRRIKFTYDSDRQFSVNQELYALALEQSLIHYFMFESADPRIRNHSLGSGRTWTGESHGSNCLSSG